MEPRSTEKKPSLVVNRAVSEVEDSFASDFKAFDLLI
jgi:hypothetical protein